MKKRKSVGMENGVLLLFFGIGGIVFVVMSLFYSVSCVCDVFQYEYFPING